MSNQTILWGMLLAPWLTLIFMPGKDVKRFMPVGLLTAVTSAIIYESGITLMFWGAGETLFPLKQTSTFIYGALPAFAMWIFKYTYGRFWTYVVTNAIFDIGFAYILLPWLVSRGIMSSVNSHTVYLINIGHEMVLYGYQMWQDDPCLKYTRAGFKKNPQPVAAKPLPEDEQNPRNGK